MRLGGVREEASAVKKYWRKYAQHMKNTIYRLHLVGVREEATAVRKYGGKYA